MLYFNFQVNLMDDHLLFIANSERERKSISDWNIQDWLDADQKLQFLGAKIERHDKLAKMFSPK